LGKRRKTKKLYATRDSIAKNKTSVIAVVLKKRKYGFSRKRKAAIQLKNMFSVSNFNVL